MIQKKAWISCTRCLNAKMDEINKFLQDMQKLNNKQVLKK